MLVVLAFALLGCIKQPKQAGGLRFFDHAGFAHRMNMLCRLGVGDENIQSACPRAKKCTLASESCPNGHRTGTLGRAPRLTE
jgi:hypothetical protein